MSICARPCATVGRGNMPRKYDQEAARSVFRQKLYPGAAGRLGALVAKI